ncbi:hypothetical protein [Zhongshania sp.]|uniref:hypothetical protein n=1 Tax=Zhongshania sp. TaxID=1971902 RepID=UPI003562CD73
MMRRGGCAAAMMCRFALTPVQPAKNIYLTGGYEAIFGAIACLSGEDDGVVQYASIFACSGSASYNNSNVCGNSAKQEVSGFRFPELGRGP